MFYMRAIMISSNGLTTLVFLLILLRDWKEYDLLNPLKAMGRIRHLYIQTLILCF